MIPVIHELFDGDKAFEVKKTHYYCSDACGSDGINGNLLDNKPFTLGFLTSEEIPGTVFCETCGKPLKGEA